MTEQTIKEIVKSFAYGFTVEQVAENENITVEEAESFMKEHSSDIESKKSDLKEGGWIE